MEKPLSLLIVDVSEAWEDYIISRERLCYINWDPIFGEYVSREIKRPCFDQRLIYPHGTTRAGFDAIVDTARIAHERGIPTYSVHFYTGWSDGEEQLCNAIKPYVHPKNRYEKLSYSAFDEKKCQLAKRIKVENCEHLMVIGYDRDCCVLETIKDAVERKITVVTSEHCMLTQNLDDRQFQSISYFEKNTIFLKNLMDVWNYIVKYSKKA